MRVKAPRRRRRNTFAMSGGMRARVGSCRIDILRRNLGDREREKKHRAVTHLALHPDTPAMRGDDALCDEEPQPGALLPWRLRPKAFEHARDIACGDSRPGVAYSEQRHRALPFD